MRPLFYCWEGRLKILDLFVRILRAENDDD